TMAFSFNGTGDSGDSIMHYLFAKNAIHHPESFLDSWAKPLFVALATPFAQFGFTGIKLFNCINTIISMMAGYLIAKRLNFNNSWLVPVLFILGPMNFALCFTGLTEPLFGTVLSLGLCLLFYDRDILGLILLSFLPFVRSEGMFLLLPIAAYMLIQKKYTSIIWLVTGQVIYALIGYLSLHDLLWFYHNNPYSLVSRYGYGDWSHYFRHMPSIAGITSSILLAIGFILIPLLLLKRNKDTINRMPLLLIWVLFSMYFFFHVISWMFGLFGSYGMVRIIIGVSPLIAIIATYGFNNIEMRFKEKRKRLFMVLVLGTNLVFMFVSLAENSGEIDMKMKLSGDQIIDKQMVDYIKNKYPDYKKRGVYFHACFLSLPLDVDPTAPAPNPMYPVGDYPPGSIYIWDNWFSVVEGGISLDSINNNKTMKRDTNFILKEPGGHEYITALYIKK
ncbi:MAG TPA: hypothetical protein VN922_13700, partial [Bacteroidia bacterium]|nr:hypothetical protein [Bacteroidia bacterium]